MGKEQPIKPLPAQAPEVPAQEAKPAFDFFEGCQNSSHPAWGAKVYKFKMPRRQPSPKKRAA